MNMNLYDQLSRFICTYSRLDPFSYYFLGICYEHTPESIPLDKLFIQLSSSFSSFTKDSILKRLAETKSQENIQRLSQNLKDGFSIVKLLKDDKNFINLLKDFHILPKLFSKVSKAQWFYLGTFMAKNQSFGIVDFLREKYSQLCGNLSKYQGEYSKANFLASLLNKTLKSDTMNIEPELTIPKKKGKVSKSLGTKEANFKQLRKSKSRLRKNKQQQTMEEEEEEKVNNANEQIHKQIHTDFQEEISEIVETLTCPICLDSMAQQCNITLSNCEHSFHLQCLQDYLQEMINRKSFPIKCSMEGCASLMLEQEILENVDKNYQEKFDSFTLKHFIEANNSKIFGCPTVNCEFFAFVDELTGRYFQCVNCEQRYCRECREGWNNEMSCGQAEFSKVAEKSGYRQCPSCRMFIEKNGGCDSMTCRCTKRFNWEYQKDVEFM